MEHTDHRQRDGHGPRSEHPGAAVLSLNRIALTATLHCLSGCAIGEVLGMVIGTALGLSDGLTIALAVVLAFLFGYAFTVVPLLRAGLAFGRVAALAFAADTASITIMEIVDNAIMLLIPGAMDAPLTDPLFWGALAVALIVAAVAAFPVNRFLIARQGACRGSRPSRSSLTMPHQGFCFGRLSSMPP